MQLSLLFMAQIGKMFLMMLVGILIVRAGLVKAESARHFSMVIVYSVIPCAIVDSFQIDYSPSRLSGLALAAAAAVIVHLLFLVITDCFRKSCRLTPVEQCSLVFSNGGQMVIPIVSAVLGQEWVFYTSGFMSVGTLLIWTVAQSRIGGSGKLQWRALLHNINILSVAAGLILFLFRLRLPGILGGAMQDIGAMIGPGCMISIGMTLGAYHRSHSLRLPRLLGISAARLLIYPLIVVALLCLPQVQQLHPDAPKILLITVVAAAAPSSAVVAQLGQIYQQDELWGSLINVVTTVLCILTMPLVIWLYQILTQVQP